MGRSVLIQELIATIVIWACEKKGSVTKQLYNQEVECDWYIGDGMKMKVVVPEDTAFFVGIWHGHFGGLSPKCTLCCHN